MRNKNNWNLPNCLDCGKRLSGYQHDRCKECGYKALKKPKSKCMDCGKELFDRRSKRCLSCANLGESNPAFGKKRSIEARMLTSIKNKGHVGFMYGKHHSEETIRKMSESHRKRVLEGKCHLWKGGIWSKGDQNKPGKLERLKFRQSIQRKVIIRDNYTCQLCGERGGKLQVDHIQSWADYIELRFEINNCRTLCMNCHYFITYGKPMPPTVRSWGHNMLKGELQNT